MRPALAGALRSRSASFALFGMSQNKDRQSITPLETKHVGNCRNESATDSFPQVGSPSVVELMLKVEGACPAKISLNTIKSALT